MIIQHAKTAVAGAQILFVAFGAMVLVPILTGLNPALALLGAGIGTLIFQLLTKRKVPIFLGSSFAFIAPIIAAKQTWGVGATMFGLFAAGFMYFVFAAVIRWRGLAAVHKLLPPVVIGPVIIVIVVGSPASSNSNRLREVAAGLGVDAYMVDNASYLQREWFNGKNKVGLTAGASAPEVLVQGVIDQIRAWGIDDVQQGAGIEESIVFVLPKELRK